MKNVLLFSLLAAVAVTTTALLLFSPTGALAQQDSKDALTNDGLGIAAAAVGYFLKPATLKEGNQGFNNIEIADCGVPETGRCGDGVFSIEAKDNELIITGVSMTEEKSAVVIVCDMNLPRQNRVTITRAAW